MARIAGVDVPRDKRIEIALTYIYGIGPTTAKRMLSLAGVAADTRTKDLSDAQVGK
jgi:small subunit ribosomal protein S13